MCGIVGFTGDDGAGLIQRMNESQRRRGPDDLGVFVSKKFSFQMGMRRLAIIDLKDGHQPMAIDQEKLWIVYNGEIFNAPDLRKQLIQLGAVFTTDHSDTEVIIQGYKTWGHLVVEKLNGMFAFCIYDERQGKIFGARDQLGIKPFHYSLKEKRFSFASEEKSLLQLPWIGRNINREALSHYFSFQAIPAPLSIFSDICKLPAAYAFEYSLDQKNFKSWKYWRPDWSVQQGELTLNQAQKKVRESFFSAIRRWMSSDVPIALSLSGGYDSTIVGAVMREVGGPKLTTYSLGFSDAPDLDERDVARQTAHMWGSQHHEMVIQAKDLLRQWPMMIESLDAPYGGGLPSWFVYQSMAKDFKVAMTGSGGDEIFGNYGKWLALQSPWKRLKRMVKMKLQGARVVDLMSFPFGSIHYPYFTDGDKAHHLFSFLPVNSSSWLQKIADETAQIDPKNLVAAVDLQFQLPEEFLMMTDRFSMAHSLEARVPFLDREFVETVVSLPAHWRSGEQVWKKLLIDSFTDLIPDHVLNRPKRGFQLPIKNWLANDLRDITQKLLSPAYLKRQGLFQENLISQYALPEYAGKTRDPFALWEILCFQLWYESTINRNTLELI